MPFEPFQIADPAICQDKNIISYSLIADESIDFDMVKVSVDSYSNVIRIASHFQYEEPD